VPEPARPEGPTEILRPFWAEAEIPTERWPYLEFSARRYPPIARALSAVAPLGDRRVLDLGGGVGGLAVVLHAWLGGSYELAEFSAPTEPHMNALRARGVTGGHRVDLTALRPLEGLPDDYDGILFVEVLEHLLVNPLLLFRDVWDHLKPGGFLFLTTPNMARLGSRMRLLAGRSIKEVGRYPLRPGEVMGHVVEYTRAELDQILTTEGFAPASHRVIQQVPAVRPSALQRLGVRLLNWDALARFELGDDILALYRKVERHAPVIRDASGRL